VYTLCVPLLFYQFCIQTDLQKNNNHPLFNFVLYLFINNTYNESLSLHNILSWAFFSITREKQIKILNDCFGFRKPLIPCVEKQLIGEHLTNILQKGNDLYLIH